MYVESLVLLLQKTTPYATKKFFPVNKKLIITISL